MKSASRKGFWIAPLNPPDKYQSQPSYIISASLFNVNSQISIRVSPNRHDISISCLQQPKSQFTNVWQKITQSLILLLSYLHNLPSKNDDASMVRYGPRTSSVSENDNEAVIATKLVKNGLQAQS